jgi:hypothetical protein
MVGVARRLASGPISNPDDFKTAYESLLQDAEYLKTIGRSTADEEFVRLRLERSTNAFAKVR